MKNTYHGLTYDAAQAAILPLALAGYFATVGLDETRWAHDAWTLSTEAPDLLVAQVSPYSLPPPNRPGYVQQVGTKRACTSQAQPAWAVALDAQLLAEVLAFQNDVQNDGTP